MWKTNEVSSQETWFWLKTETLKKETEVMPMAARDQALKPKTGQAKLTECFISV